MIKNLARILYFPLKTLVGTAFLLYFKRVQLKGMSNIPKQGAAFFASNHQNALLDALILSVFDIRSPHFLTRANVFNNPKIGAFLRGLRMLPVYRFRDGLANVKRNTNTFEEAMRVLEQDKVIGVFPEGNHSLKYGIRSLQRGLPRIAFGMSERNDFKKDVYIIPIGIYYEDHFSSWGRVLVNVGEAFNLLPFAPLYQENPKKGHEAVLAELSKRMKKLTLHFPEDADYDSLKKKFDQRRVYKNDLLEQLEADQNLVNALWRDENYQEQHEKIAPLVWIYWKFRKLFKTFTYPAHRLINAIVAQKVKDPHFIGSIRFVLTAFLYPVYFFLLGMLIWWLVSGL
jgi:1-acyl-sn-glycerol-3-phosphate acyltransferase